MSTKFFNNDSGNTLFDRLASIAGANGMGEKFQVFKAVAGYFRSSGWFKLRNHLGGVKKIQILVGIDIDDILRNRDRTELFFGASDEEARKRYFQAFADDVRQAGYSADIEQGILQLCQDVVDGKVELRIHRSRDLHAKFYLCLPETYGEDSVGRVVMGSSNLTDSGLGTTTDPMHRYELNVELRDFDDVDFCRQEFERLWAEGVPVTSDDIVAARQATHLGQEPTPFELFMRVWIDLYGDQAEDRFEVDVPKGMKNLKYQHDAVVQGYQLLRKYDGFFLADVVGLGKTVVAAMIARRFIAENGTNTKILVVYPPAVEQNWKETFEAFRITKRQAKFVSNGSLHKVLDEHDGTYLAPEEYDLVVVDESHGFRNTSTQAYGCLQRICRAPRPSGGHVPGVQKKVVLVTATALNNSPSDFLNQIRLFQDDRACTIDGIRDLAGFFAPLIQRYRAAMRSAKATGVVNTKEIDDIYEKIRQGVLEKIVIRRTRQNILNDPNYAADLVSQGIVFPTVHAPNEILYTMNASLASLFSDTCKRLQKDVHYARYRAIEFLDPKYKTRYPHAKHVADILAAVYRVLMVKRLESSFHAFKKSLETFLRSTRDMIKMFDADSVLIIPDLDVAAYLEQGYTFADVIKIAEERRGYKAADISYPAADFDSKLLTMLREDEAVLSDLVARWGKVTHDPKLDRFESLLRGELFDKARNPEGKLVVFSESTDTLEYLETELRNRLGRSDILRVDSETRANLEGKIRENFDANWPERHDEWNILLCSDALSEGVNLHRANIVVNYDSPWNATRLMQRIGRVNRIGSTAGEIHNYLFYPSTQGNQIIGLYQYSLIRMQGFHSALGEDAQIYTRDELLRAFKLFDANPRDDMDDLLKYLRLLREFHAKHPDDYERIKALPVKCRVARNGGGGSTLVYLANNARTAFFEVSSAGDVSQLASLDILKRLEAAPAEKALPWTDQTRDSNYSAVCKVLKLFEERAPTAAGVPLTPGGGNAQDATALSFLRKCSRWLGPAGPLDPALKRPIDDLTQLVELGRYVHLTRALYHLSRRYAKQPNAAEAEVLGDELSTLHDTYPVAGARHKPVPEDPLTLIASETFAT